MKNKYLFVSLFIAIIFLSGNLNAQDFVFKVMASSGASKTSYPNVKGKDLYVGSKLQDIDQISIPAKSYLSLMHSTGGTVQIAKAGNYSVSDLAAKLKASTKTATQKYASYVVGELTKGEDANMAKYPHKYQNVTGSVERATFESELVTMLSSGKEGSFVLKDNSYLLTWHHLANTKNYILVVMDHFDETLLEVSIPDTSYTLSIDNPKFVGADMLKIVILSKEREDITPYSSNNEYAFSYGFNFLEGGKKAKFEAAYKAFKEEQANSDNPEDIKKLDEATFYEQQGFLLDALKSYQDLVKLDPENEAYEIVYNQFLVRHQIGKHKEILNAEKQ